MRQEGRLFHKLVILLIIFCSADTLLFGSNGDRRFILLRYLIEAGVLFLLFVKNLYKQTIRVGTREIVFLYMTLLVVCSGIFNNDMIMGNFYIVMMLCLGVFLTKTITLDDFANFFCEIMKFFSVVSIIFFALYVCCYGVMQFLPIITNSAGREDFTIILSSMPTQFYRNQYRNSSFFREPGVFQMYLIWAMMFEMFWKRKMKLINCAIFAVALITTFSTTAYIAVAMLLCCYFIKKGDNRDWVIRGILIFVGGVLLVYILEFTNLLAADGIIFGKFTESNNPSVSARWASVVVNCIMILRRPLFGNGLTFVEQNYSDYAMEYLGAKVADNTNMVLYLMATFGIAYGIMFVVGIWKFCGKVATSRLIQLGFFCIFMVLFIGENLVFSPITYIFIFYGLDKAIPCGMRKKYRYEDNVVM